MTTPIRILPAALLLALTSACGDDGDPSTGTLTNTTPPATDPSAGETDNGEGETGETGDTPTTSGSPTSAETGGTTTTDPTADTGETTAPVDPCAACDANATCEDDQCVCKDGFDGDGLACADIDECAGQNDCDIDATCSNTPGSYDCACNAGYKGNGYDCEDIDECTQDLDDCSDHASCTNQDGTFKCTCNDGYMGDGKTCNGSAEFGEPCSEGEDCASGLCLLGEPSMCTITCTQAVANDCGAQMATGLCVLADAMNDVYVCAGDLTFGNDPDDAIIMNDGDQLVRNFQTVTDADLFLINLPAATWQVAAYPDPDDEIQIEFYNGDASSLGTIPSPGVGMPVGGNVDSGGGVFFAVVRNTGNSNGKYTITVNKV